MSKKTKLDDTRAVSAPEDEPPIKFRISPIRAPYAKEDNLVQLPGETPMDDTDKVALGAPRFRREEKVVTILSAEKEVVPWYKQKFVGHRCSCLDENEKEGVIEKAYCPICFHTGTKGGYDKYKLVRLFNLYIEWGGIEPPFPQGRLISQLDFEYHVTPGDFFELGKTLADVGFNVDAGIGERHDNEGQPCLWRIENVSVDKDENDFPLCWLISCRNVEPYEPIMGWFREHAEVQQ